MPVASFLPVSSADADAGSTAEPRLASIRVPAAMMYTVALLLCSSAAALQAPMAVRPAVGVSAVTAAQPVARASDVVMGATIRELRDRVGSVKNTKKITSAMKLVAAAKVRRAQEAVLRSRPFSETLERILGGLLQRLKTEALDIPLLETRTATKVGLVVITGDRGLCGGYNANAIKKAEQRIAELKAQVRGVCGWAARSGGCWHESRASRAPRPPPRRRARGCTPFGDFASGFRCNCIYFG